MSDQSINKELKSTNELADDRTELAYERTALANDRTLIAWVRTSVSLISFGFTIYKFFGDIVKSANSESSGYLISPRGVGLILIALGFFCVFFGMLQYHIDMKRIRSSAVKVKLFSFAPILAIIICIFSALLFITAVIK